MNEPLQSTLVDAVHFLKSQRVPYALVGGLAASLRGQPRVTADVDLVIRADIECTLEMTTTLENSSFRPLFDCVEEVVRSAFILPLRHRSTGVKVDMALGLSGFEQEIISRRKR